MEPVSVPTERSHMLRFILEVFTVATALATAGYAVARGRSLRLRVQNCTPRPAAMELL